MLKAKVTLEDDTPCVVLGLSEENIRRLRAGNPIMFSGWQIGIPGSVMIRYGATEGAIAQALGINVGRSKQKRNGDETP